MSRSTVAKPNPCSSPKDDETAIGVAVRQRLLVASCDLPSHEHHRETVAAITHREPHGAKATGARRRGKALVVALLLLATIAGGCASGVRATRVTPREADRMLAANVLATGEPSAWSLQTLHRNALLDLYREDRVEALRKLHASLAEPDLERVRVRDRLFALSELSFDHARREGERSFMLRGEDPRPWFLASAVYALGFVRLEPDDSRDALALDSRTRLAADLYNRGITDGLQEGGVLRVADGVRPLPF